MQQRTLRPLALLILATLLMQGCSTLVVGGGTAGGVSLAFDRRSLGNAVEDQNIELKALNLVLSDPELLDQTNISATSYNRWVLLTGQAANEKLKQRVINAVKGFGQIDRIIDEIEITPPSVLSERTQDSYITSKVKLRLFEVRMQGFDPTKVKVVTERGVVYLMGLLSEREQEAVARVTSYTDGVRRVVTVFETIR